MSVPTRRLQTSFAVVALAFGGLLGLALPPLQAIDEPSHFFSAALLAEGSLVPHRAAAGSKEEVPAWTRRTVVEFNRMLFQIGAWRPTPEALGQRFARIDATDTTPRTAKFSRPYSPVSYLPQAAALWLARALDAPGWLRFYAGRAAGLLCWIGMVLLVLRVAPVLGEAFWLLATTPMALSTAASYSADTITTGTAWLFIASVLRLALDDTTRWNASWAAWLTALGAAVALAKYAYLPVVGLVVLVPARRFRSRRDRRRAILAILAISVASLAAWVVVAGLSTIEPPVRWDLPADARPWSDLAADAPGRVLAVARAAWGNLGQDLRSMIGRLGMKAVALPSWAVAFYTIALVGAAITGGERWATLSAGLRLSALAIAASIFAGILAVASLRWSLDPGVVEGFQGRYLLPIAPLVLLPLVVPRWTPTRTARRSVHAFVALLTCVALSASARAVLHAYYGPSFGLRSIPGMLSSARAGLQAGRERPTPAPRPLGGGARTPPPGRE